MLVRKQGTLAFRREVLEVAVHGDHHVAAPGLDDRLIEGAGQQIPREVADHGMTEIRCGNKTVEDAPHLASQLGGDLMQRLGEPSQRFSESVTSDECSPSG